MIRGEWSLFDPELPVTKPEADLRRLRLSAKPNPLTTFLLAVLLGREFCFQADSEAKCLDDVVCPGKKLDRRKGDS